MNLGIVTSSIIAGILMLAIIAMNVNLSRSTGELTLRQITQQNVTTTADLITHDIPKIGFKRLGGVTNPILAADSTEIIFESDIDNSGDMETVIWLYDTTDPVTAGSNPDDYVLKRGVANGIGLTAGAIESALLGGTIDKLSEMSFGFTDFDFIYYDEDRNKIPSPVANPSNIYQIKVEFLIESKEKYADSGGYTESIWSKTFTPKNIN